MMRWLVDADALFREWGPTLGPRPEPPVRLSGLEAGSAAAVSIAALNERLEGQQERHGRQLERLGLEERARPGDGRRWSRCRVIL